ncbi:hypothetical protein [Nostoc commune]|uniref:hypothetical protein n=1 Tax=Nostoc commune TaxID=1178 RepID=UPI0011B25892|nr:hypothetical protein [Nostoc commune]
MQFECQSLSTYTYYNIFLDKKNFGQLGASTGSLSDPIPLPVGKREHLFTFKDGNTDEEVDSVMVKVK